MQQSSRLDLAKRAVIYLCSALMPPLMFGTLTAISNFKSLMLREKPASLELPHPLPEVRFRPGKLKAAILVSNDGSQITDVLGPYALLAESGAFDVYTVASRRELSLTTGDLAILPDFSFKEAPQADLLVVPALLEPGYPPLIEWVKKQAAGARTVLSVCEGARVTAQAGLLEGREATSHFISLPQLKERYPGVRWVENRRVVIAGADHISSAGITASLDGTLAAIEKLAGPEAAARARKLVPASSTAGTIADTTAGINRTDWAQLYLRAGFDWTRPGVAVWVLPGASELALAAALDLFPRTHSARVFSVGEKRELIRTAHGLWVAPTEKMELAPPAAYVVLPQATGSSQGAETLYANALKWTGMAKATAIDWRTLPESDIYPSSLRWIQEHQGAKVAAFVAKTIELAPPTDGVAAPSWPLRLFGPMAGMALVGLLTGIWLEKRFRLSTR